MANSEKTPLPAIDMAAADALWSRYLESVGQEGSDRYTDVSCFGDSVEMADELIDLVLRGHKRATAGSLAEYEQEAIPTPEVGDRWIACDGRGRPRAVLETTEVRIGALSSVDSEFAWDEGEGNRTREDWLRGHTAYFKRSHAALGVPFDDDMPVVFERFEVEYQESNPESGAT